LRASKTLGKMQSARAQKSQKGAIDE